ncbi:PIG-L family deacetylase [Candidatus Woesearchaeota archaeon]|nr:PIG-L family deacetylase [Candidatus Woesearchaeota archaeon]
MQAFRASAMEKKTILVFCAHSDDQIFGPGGAIANYSRNGHEVTTVIFSYGELTHPWIRRRIAAETRENEAIEADKIIGGKEVLFLRIKDPDLVKEAKAHWVKERVAHLIKAYKPEKIFTHSIDDLHPAHRAVYRTVIAALDSGNYKCDTYTFDIWNPLNFRDRDQPKMYVDITGTFSLKVKALKCFRSQWISMIFLLWSVYARALTNGLDSGFLYAEKFHKAR